MRERMTEDMMETQAVSYLDRVLTVVNMKGNFFPLLEKTHSATRNPAPSFTPFPFPTSMVRVFQPFSTYHVQPGDLEENKDTYSAVMS